MTDRDETTGLPRRRLITAAPALALGAVLGVGGSARAQDEKSALTRVRERGRLVVGLYHDLPPFHVKGQGIDMELAQALAKGLGVELSPLPFNAGENMNDDLRNMVWKGHYLGYGPADVMLHVPVDKYFQQNNKQAVIFAPYLREQVVLARDTRRLPKVGKAEDLKGVPLAAERGTGAASALIGHENHMLSSQVQIYEDGIKAMQAVLDGKAAAAYITRAQAETAIFQANPKPEHIEIIDFPLQGVPRDGWPVGMAIKSGNDELGKELVQALTALRSNGQLLALFKQHGLTLVTP